jgi:hypothetical protein
MSTRSAYIFKDEGGSYAVYKHCDGYPTGAANSLINAKKYAWQGNRFEADEFACAFITAEKVNSYASCKKYRPKGDKEPIDAGGQMRLLEGIELKHMPIDIEYLYIIRNTANDPMSASRVKVSAYEVNFPWGDKAEPQAEKHLKLIFECGLDDVKAVAKAFEAGRE